MTWDFEAIRQPITEKLIAGEGWWVESEPYGYAFTHDQPSPYGPERIWKNSVKYHPEIALVLASKEALRLAAVEMGNLPVCGTCGAIVTMEFHKEQRRFFALHCNRCEEEDRRTHYEDRPGLATTLAMQMGAKVASEALGRELTWEE